MKYVLYNPEEKDILAVLKKTDRKNYLIIDLKDRFKKYGSINFFHTHWSHKMKTNSWLQNWSYSKIQGRTIKEIFSHDDQTLFYLLSYFFLREQFLFKGRVGLNLTYTFIDLFYDFVDDDISVISYDPHIDHFVRVLNKICEKKGHSLTVLKNANLKMQRFEILCSYNWPIRCAVKSRIMARYVIGRIRKWLGLVNTIRSDVLFLSNTRFSRVREDENVMFGTLMKELRRLGVSTKTVNYALLHKLEFLKDFVKRFMFIKTNYIGDYYSLATLRANKRLFSKYKRLWKEIRNAAELKKSFVYREIDVFEFAQPLFDLIFDSLSYLSVDNLNITKKMLEKEKPKVFVLDHEDNFYGKGLMMNAKNKRINSLALQHEAIIPEDCNHSHIKDKSALDKNSVFWRPLPDKKCVWAVYSRRILMDLCNYSADRIVVTGNPMFDDLVSEKFNKSQLLQKYSLPADTKLVLYATEGYKRDPELFLDGIKSMKNALFIIKPHPSEDANLYLLLQKKYRLKNLVLLPKSANFHELIAISDVLVTKTSAAGIEAMIKKIPVVIFNPDDVFNPWKYVQSGAAVNAKNCTELKKQITMLLTDSRLRKKLSAQASKFVYNVAYKQDGNATRRVAKVIMQLLDK